MIVRGDARSLPVASGCVQTVITSPPYWGLRDYGTANQIGLESTPAEYVSSLLAVFAEVWRVMRDDGTAWLNLGDSYYTGGKISDGPSSRRRANGHETLKMKDLIGIPWRVAFALQDAGWYLRSDIIWAKPNPMPESVTDRPTRSHEYVFLLSKSPRYFYDAKAISEKSSGLTGGRFGAGGPEVGRLRHDMMRERPTDTGTRNKRSVWTVPTSPYSGAHFATFPEALILPCVLAGSREGDLVLDPFCGTATVGAVAARHGRRFIGVDLAYHDLSKERTSQRGLFVGVTE